MISEKGANIWCCWLLTLHFVSGQYLFLGTSHRTWLAPQSSATCIPVTARSCWLFTERVSPHKIDRRNIDIQCKQGKSAPVSICLFFLCSPPVRRPTVWPLVHQVLCKKWRVHHLRHQLVQFCQSLEPQGLLCYWETQSPHVSIYYLNKLIHTFKSIVD